MRFFWPEDKKSWKIWDFGGYFPDLEVAKPNPRTKILTNTHHSDWRVEGSNTPSSWFAKNAAYYENWNPFQVFPMSISQSFQTWPLAFKIDKDLNVYNLYIFSLKNSLKYVQYWFMWMKKIEEKENHIKNTTLEWLLNVRFLHARINLKN